MSRDPDPGIRRPGVSRLFQVVGGWLSDRRPPAVEALAGAEQTTVAMRLENRLPVIEISVAGRTCPVLLDLGGFDTIALAPEALKSLEIEYTGKQRKWRNAGGERFRSREYVLPEVEIGDLRLVGCRGHEDLEPGRPAGTALGTLGLGVLKRFKVVIDYPDESLTLRQDDARFENYAAHEWRSVPFRLTRSGVVTALRVEGRTLRCVWDTGYQHSVIKAKATPPDQVRTVEDQRRFTARGLAFREVVLSPVDFILHDFRLPPVEAVIGFDFFRDHAIFLDFEERILAIDD